MAINGVFRAVLSSVTKKGGNGQAVNKAFDNASVNAAALDPKGAKKVK